MGSNTSIEWAHHTFNPWSGCEKVSAGCAHCYAAALPPGMRRHAEWGKDRPRVMASESYWSQPLAWNRAAKKAGERHRVFCASTADVFEAREDLDGARARLFYTIQITPHLDWLLLTKRPEYAAAWWVRYATLARSEGHTNQWPANAWIGTSVENQAAADERIPHLLRIPARVRFLSCEPLLGAVEGLDRYLSKAGLGRVPCILCQGSGLKNRVPGHLGSGLHGDPPCPDCHRGAVGGVGWVIAGGESGRHARPMHPDWARSLRDQCVGAGVPFFFKQWGGWAPTPLPWDADEVASAAPSGIAPWRDTATGGNVAMLRVGKATAGRLLDGREWSEVPRGE